MRITQIQGKANLVEPKYLNIYEIISRLRNFGMVGGFLTNFERGVEQVSFYVNFKLTLQHYNNQENITLMIGVSVGIVLIFVK